ncbi:ArsR/SmtB family transcription factor [Streptomyces sp. 7R007]
MALGIGGLMLRIHFTSDDLQRIRLATEPDPMWEVICSLCRLQSKESELVFGQWWQRATTELAHPSYRLVRAVLRPLVPLGPYIPDFLTPAEPAAVPEEAIDKVLSTPPWRLRSELEVLGSITSLPTWTTELAEGRKPALERLGQALQSYFDATLAPVWHDVHVQIDADVNLRVRQLVDGGSEALLRGLPTARWESPVLLLPYPHDRDLYLDGRGLRLVPSYFCWRRVLTLVDESLTPTLVYPVQREVAGQLTALVGDRHRPGLPALLGRSRALLLRSLTRRVCMSTSEAAQGAGVSLSAASQHISVLRAAGLVTSQRDGKRVLHCATRLGRALVDSGAVRHR